MITLYIDIENEEKTMTSKNIIIKKKQFNKEQMIQLINMERENNTGNCVGFSFQLFQKLEKVGAKRVRGRVNNTHLFTEEKLYSRKVAKSDAVHYWVEANGMVFDENEFSKLIMPKKEFYEMYDISNVEYADNGFFCKNNYELGNGPDDDKYLNKYCLPNKMIMMY